MSSGSICEEEGIVNWAHSYPAHDQSSGNKEKGESVYWAGNFP